MSEHALFVCNYVILETTPSPTLSYSQPTWRKAVSSQQSKIKDGTLVAAAIGYSRFCRSPALQVPTTKTGWTQLGCTHLHKLQPKNLKEFNPLDPLSEPQVPIGFIAMGHPLSKPSGSSQIHPGEIAPAVTYGPILSLQWEIRCP